MQLIDYIEEAKVRTGMSQGKLAEAIHLTKQNFSSILAKRRSLPAEAAIELSELTGESAKKIWLAALNWRARDDSNVRPLPSEGNTLSN